MPGPDATEMDPTGPIRAEYLTQLVLVRFGFQKYTLTWFMFRQKFLMVLVSSSSNDQTQVKLWSKLTTIVK